MEILIDKRAIKYIRKLDNVLRKAVKSLNEPSLVAKYLKKADEIVDKIHSEYCIDSECDSLVLVVDNIYYNILRILDGAINGDMASNKTVELAEKYLSKLERLLPKEYREGSPIKKLFELL